MRKRIVVIGFGCISPLANDWPNTRKALAAGISGVAPITHFDASRYETRFAAEVKVSIRLRFSARKKPAAWIALPSSRWRLRCRRLNIPA